MRPAKNVKRYSRDLHQFDWIQLYRGSFQSHCALLKSEQGSKVFDERNRAVGVVAVSFQRSYHQMIYVV